jgi:hypothetical protein
MMHSSTWEGYIDLAEEQLDSDQSVRPGAMSSSREEIPICPRIIISINTKHHNRKQNDPASALPLQFGAARWSLKESTKEDVLRFTQDRQKALAKLAARSHDMYSISTDGTCQIVSAWNLL